MTLMVTLYNLNRKWRSPHTLSCSRRILKEGTWRLRRCTTTASTCPPGQLKDTKGSLFACDINVTAILKTIEKLTT